MNQAYAEKFNLAETCTTVIELLLEKKIYCFSSIHASQAHNKDADATEYSCILFSHLVFNTPAVVDITPSKKVHFSACPIPLP